MHEAQLHERNSFVTLTYAKAPLTLHYTDYQAFMRRLRKSTPALVRFYMAGEYGELTARPHFHAILFGIDWEDKKLFKKTPSGNLYTSQTLTNLWAAGHCTTADVTFQTAAYVARYVMKKVTGPAATHHYQVLDPTTGELVTRRPEFNKMSLKPGIAAAWFERFRSDVFPGGQVVQNGNLRKAPRYYDKLEERQVDSHLDAAKAARLKHAREHRADNTPQRLRDREIVALAGLNKRSL